MAEAGEDAGGKRSGKAHAAQGAAELRREVTILCARFRTLAEKVCAGETADNNIAELRKTIQAYGVDLEPYEESVGEICIPSHYKCTSAAPRPQLYLEFWAAVERHDLQGATDLVDPILELETRDASRRASARMQAYPRSGLILRENVVTFSPD
jgi:hypothetical protein